MSQFAYVIDDEEAVRVSLRALLGVQGNRLVVTFPSADAFFETIADREPGVVLADLHMPGMSGIDLLIALQPFGARFPVIMVTGQGDIPLAVKAMRLGAVDFLEKPYDHQALFNAVDHGFDLLAKSASGRERETIARAKIATLSRREREILDLLINGASNRGMADQLGLSVRTVEVHRAKVMAKLDASSLSAAINLAYCAGIIGDGTE